MDSKGPREEGVGQADWPTVAAQMSRAVATVPMAAPW